MRRLIRLGTLAMLAAFASSCEDTVTSSTPTTQNAQIAVGARLTASASATFDGLTTFGLKVATVRARIVAPDSTVRDTLLAFPGSVQAVKVVLQVPPSGTGKTFRIDIDLFDANGFVLFSGSQRLVAVDPMKGPVASTDIDVNYSGPGAGAARIVVTPPDTSGMGALTIPVMATAYDAAGAVMGSVLVRWSSSDATLASVTSFTGSTGNVTTSGKRGTVTITATTPFGLTGTARMSLVPPPSKIVVVSGTNQTSFAGSPLPNPLVVQVQAADNLPVPGVAVTFKGEHTTCKLAPPSIVADANGMAQTSLTLGTDVGDHHVEVSSGALTPVVIVAKATPAPASAIIVVSGNNQSGPVATALPQPLVARVTNRFGAPIAGATVQWSTTPNTGTLGTATSVTGSDGLASTTYTAGTSVKNETVRAAVSGVALPGGETFFNIAVTPGAAATLTAMSGMGQHGAAATRLANPLVVIVEDRYGNPVPNLGITWQASAQGRATFSPANSGTDASGLSSTSVTLGNTIGAFTVVASVLDLTATFDLSIDQGSLGAPGYLSGMVYNGVTGTPLSGVSVSIVPAGSALGYRASPAALDMARSNSGGYMASTGSDGRWTVWVEGACYDITYSFGGFVMSVIYGECVDGNTVTEAVPMVPTSAAPGSITGTVINATTNQAVMSSVVVELRAGMHNTAGQPLATLTTTNGQYQFTGVTAGTYTVRAVANGFSSTYRTGISVGATNTTNQNIVISPVGAAGQVRIVLTWRATPRDLDSHLTGPRSDGSRFHVWYAGSGYCQGAPFACLDVDVTSGYGPETVTITELLTTQRYRYSVQNYTAAGNGSNPYDQTLSNSGGRVDLYIDNALVQTFSVPAGAGSLWTVFELQGTTVIPINAISAGPVLLPLLAPGEVQPASAVTDEQVIMDAIRAQPKVSRPR